MGEFNVNNNFGRTTDVGVCQTLCQNTPTCEWFNWDRNMTCFLKTGMGNDSRAEPGGATGPAFCIGK